MFRADAVIGLASIPLSPLLFRADAVIGLASIPLSPLLQECWVDGTANVYALAANAAHPGEAKLQVGTLRAVISLEDKGPGVLSPPHAATPPHVPALFGMPPPPHAGHQHPHLAPKSTPTSGSAAAGGGTGGGAAGGDESAGRGVGAMAQAAAQMQPSVPEYEAAWELEVWKRAEQVKWRAEMKERESQRMATLEAEWRRREKTREAEVASMKKEYTALDDRTRQLLAATEDRERRLVVAEEAVLRRRRDMEREHVARMTEAEAAVRRLQVECEHQLEIERDRSAEVLRQRSALEERLAVMEARYASLEQAFSRYREMQRNTSEAVLQRELMEVKENLRRSDEKLSRASKGKAAYKEQVVKLAEQLAVVYKEQQSIEAGLDGHVSRYSKVGGVSELARMHMDTSALNIAAEEQARNQQVALSALRQQLQQLKASALAHVSPTAPQRSSHQSDTQNPLDQHVSAGQHRGSQPTHADPSAGQYNGRQPTHADPSAGQYNGSQPTRPDLSAGQYNGSQPTHPDPSAGQGSGRQTPPQPSAAAFVALGRGAIVSSSSDPSPGTSTTSSSTPMVGAAGGGEVNDSGGLGGEGGAGRQGGQRQGGPGGAEGQGQGGPGPNPDGSPPPNVPIPIAGSPDRTPGESSQGRGQQQSERRSTGTSTRDDRGTGAWSAAPTGSAPPGRPSGSWSPGMASPEGGRWGQGPSPAMGRLDFSGGGQEDGGPSGGTGDAGVGGGTSLSPPRASVSHWESSPARSRASSEGPDTWSDPYTLHREPRDQDGGAHEGAEYSGMHGGGGMHGVGGMHGGGGDQESGGVHGGGGRDHTPEERPEPPTPVSMAEVRRLLRRKAELLQTGVYCRTDALIVRIDQRVQQLAGMLPDEFPPSY
eukprot:gene5676-3536_t